MSLGQYPIPSGPPLRLPSDVDSALYGRFSMGPVGALSIDLDVDAIRRGHRSLLPAWPTTIGEPVAGAFATGVLAELTPSLMSLTDAFIYGWLPFVAMRSFIVPGSPLSRYVTVSKRTKSDLVGLGPTGTRSLLLRASPEGLAVGVGMRSTLLRWYDLEPVTIRRNHFTVMNHGTPAFTPLRIDDTTKQFCEVLRDYAALAG